LDARCNETSLYCAKQINNSMFIKDLSMQHQYNVTLLHMEININMFISPLMLKNKYHRV
jgi:hypothetical protein